MVMNSFSWHWWWRFSKRRQLLGFCFRTCACPSIPDIDDCSNPNPCLNGGTCHDLVHDFGCTCVSGNTDKDCSTGNIDILRQRAYTFTVLKLITHENVFASVVTCFRLSFCRLIFYLLWNCTPILIPLLSLCLWGYIHCMGTIFFNLDNPS